MLMITLYIIYGINYGKTSTIQARNLQNFIITV